MKCLRLIFASLSLLLSFSLCSPVKFENFGSDILGLIAEYLNDPAGSLGSVNVYGRNCFTEEYPSKHFFNKRFQIPELKNIDKNEPELRFLLTLSPLSSNPLHVFYAVFDQVIRGKTHYDRLYVPLMSYISRVFDNLPTADQNRILDDDFPSFGHYLTRYHENKGDYKAAFESIMHNHQQIFSWFYERKDNAEVYKMFIANPQLVDIIKGAFVRNYNYNTYIIISNQTLKGIWTFNCILNDAPEHYYIDFLAQNPNLIVTVIRNAYNLLKDVPETEYLRIYYKFKTYLNQFYAPANENDRIFYNLLVDVRFGPELDGPIIISAFTDHQKILIAKAAVLGNKIEVFHQIFDNWGGELFMDALKQYYHYGTMEHLLIIFAGQRFFSQKELDAFFSNPHELVFLSNFYAPRHIYISNDKLFVNLVAPSSLPSSCPRFITFALPATEETYHILFAEQGSNTVWSNMKVIDEETLDSFLFYYDKIPDLAQYKFFNTSLEVIKLIISSPVLINKISDMDVMLCFNNENSHEKKVEIILEFLDSIEDAKSLSSIFSLEEFQDDFITNLRTESQLKKFEDLIDLSVADIFLSQETLGPMTEYDYFKWRFVLGYWIKSDRRQDIAQITSPAIITLLRIEFYDEMLKLVGRETLENNEEIDYHEEVEIDA